MDVPDFKSKVDFDKCGLDKIKLNYADVRTLLAWRDLNGIFVRSFKPVLDEGFIDIYDKDCQEYFKFNPKLGTVTLMTTIGKTPVVSFDYNLITGAVSNEVINPDLKGFYSERESIQDTLTIYASLMAYMEYNQEHPSVITRTMINSSIVKPQNKNGKKQSIKERTVKITKTIYDITITQEDLKAVRHYGRHIEAWTVKGHWRTIKSGKKIWVKAHTKGQGHLEAKTYII